MTSYFTVALNLENLKKQYRALALTHHPDRGGDKETMQRINEEYEQCKEKLSAYEFTNQYQAYAKTKQIPKEWDECESIEELIQFQRERNFKKGWVYYAANKLGLINCIEDLEEMQEALEYSDGWVYHKAKELGLI